LPIPIERLSRRTVFVSIYSPKRDRDGTPRSDSKRNTILVATAKVFAERGPGASTSAISAAAAVADGTLFLYFKTKDDLQPKLHQ
jgi:AcrR family transcriptional regulator